MAKQKTKKKIAISQGKWRDIRIRSETAKNLQIIKINLDLLTYDEIIAHLLEFYKSRRWDA
jgi:hypothetical protein